MCSPSASRRSRWSSSSTNSSPSRAPARCVISPDLPGSPRISPDLPMSPPLLSSSLTCSHLSSFSSSLLVSPPLPSSPLLTSSHPLSHPHPLPPAPPRVIRPLPQGRVHRLPHDRPRPPLHPHLPPSALGLHLLIVRTTWMHIKPRSLPPRLSNPTLCHRVSQRPPFDSLEEQPKLRPR